MSGWRIEPAGAGTAGIAALIAASDAQSAALYPAPSRHPLGLAELARPDIVLFAASQAGSAVGCVALRLDPDGWGEVKRLFVAEGARGRGVARALLRALESGAERRRLSLLRLETGYRSPAAIRLYETSGFVRCGRFGGYPDDPMSLFMEKRLAADADQPTTSPAANSQ